MGRPSLKTPELVTEICERLATGEPMAWICRGEGMPSVTTVWNWEQEDAEFAESIARAREIGGDAIAADALAIADERQEDPASRRVMVETRLKLLAKWHPKRYGDKVQQDHVSSDGSMKPVINLSFVKPTPSDG